MSQPKCEAHLFPFLDDNSDLACFYKKICHTVINISTNETNRENVDALTKLAKERFETTLLVCYMQIFTHTIYGTCSYSSEHKMKLTTSYGHLLEIDERNAFRMLLWLCIYNKFYVKKVQISCRFSSRCGMMVL